MIYRLVRFVARTALRIYFRKIQVTGRDNVPDAGPVILAGNHPNSLVDPLVIASFTGRRVSFMAKSTLFENPFVGWFLRSFGAIPVYRRQDNPLDMSKNIEALSEAYRVLERSEALGIFPEGLSHGDLAVRRLKTGVARIALETEAKHGFALNTMIVPVGLNFDDRTTFRSDLLVNVGRPIAAANYRAAYASDPQQAVRELVEEIQLALERLVLTVREVDLEGLVLRLHDIYGDDLSRFAASLARSDGRNDASPRSDRGSGRSTAPSTAGEPPSRGTMPPADFEIKKRISAALDHLHEKDPALILDLRDRVETYLEKLRRLKLTDASLRREASAGVLLDRALRILLLGLAGSPVALLGAIGNYVPYRLTGFVGSRFSRPADRTVVSSAKIIAGVVFFPVYYVLQVGALWAWAGGGAAALWFVAAILTGPFALQWSSRMRRYREEIRFATLYMTSRRLIGRVRRERRRLIHMLDRLRDQYLEERQRHPARP